MSRDTSVTFRQAVYGQRTEEALLVLIKIDHEDFVGLSLDPLRFTSDGVDTVSTVDGGSESYLSYPFRIILPSNIEVGITHGSIVIDNIDRSIVSAIRQISSKPCTVSIWVVLASSPNTVEAEFTGFRFSNINYDKLIISGEITIENFLSEPFPGDTFLPSTFPGLF